MLASAPEVRRRWALDLGAARRCAARADVLVLVTLGQDQQQALPHRDRDLAPRAEEQRRLHVAELPSRIVVGAPHARSSSTPRRALPVPTAAVIVPPPW